MEVRPNYCSLGSAFGESTIFKVPRYQRAYSWDDEQVTEYCSDMMALYQANHEGKPIEHFLGGIVCVREANADELDEKNVYHLVDGQQRLSTTILFFSRLIKKILDLDLDDQSSKLRERRVEEYSRKYIQLTYEENNQFISVPRITLSKRDELFFDNLIRGSAMEQDALTKSQLLISRASEIIDVSLNTLIEGNSEESLEKLKVLYQVVSKNCKVLMIKMSDVKDAYRLFQVINDRGRSLTPGDLLRASSLGDLDSLNLVTESRLDELIDLWDEITKSGPKFTDDKLMEFYTSRTGKKIKRTSLFEEFNQEFFQNHSELEQNIVDLSEGVKDLEKLSRGEWPYKNSSLSLYQRTKLKNLVVNMKHTHSLPLLLAASKLREKKFYQLVFFLEKFFFVFKVALDKRISPVSAIYYENIRSINASPTTYQVSRFVGQIYTVLVSKVTKTDLESFFKDLEYIEGGDNRAIKQILLAIEESIGWIEQGCRRGALGMYKHHRRALLPETSLYSIEHIYPANAETPIQDLEAVKNRLGNLTLLHEQDNSSLGNLPFRGKKERYAGSNMSINNSLSGLDDWGFSEYQQRANFILQQFISIFSFSQTLRD